MTHRAPAGRRLEVEGLARVEGEGAMVVALGLVDVPAESALALSIMFGLGVLCVGLPGGVLWLGRQRTAAEAGSIPLNDSTPPFEAR